MKLIQKYPNWLRKFFLLLFIMNILYVSEFHLLKYSYMFLFLTLLPGILIVKILRIPELENVVLFVLAVGLSISFHMIYGIILNSLSLMLGYKEPLSAAILLVTLNVILILFAFLGYYVNKNQIISLPPHNLNKNEKIVLIASILLPTLSVFGMYVMNNYNENIYLIILFFLIAIYLIVICIFNKQFPSSFYPIIIYSISLSLLLLLPLRSDNIIGIDSHLEYYFFKETLTNLYWTNIAESTLDSCLSVSLLPTIYNSLLGGSSLHFYKLFYSLVYTISPLVVYIIGRKYLVEVYAFLASCFYMFQTNFIFTELNARTNLAILFFGLSIMVLFLDKIQSVNKRLLLMIFMISCLFSHYSTTYIFFFMILCYYIISSFIYMCYGYKSKPMINLTFVMLFFVFIFFWYGLISNASFESGVFFIKNSISSLNTLFLEEARQTDINALFGKAITEKGFPHKIQFIFTWLSLFSIGIGLLFSSVNSIKETDWFSYDDENGFTKKVDLGFFIFAYICLILLFLIVIVPHVSVGYSMERLYALCITVLSVFFVSGCVVISKYAKVAKLALLLFILIPYFFCVNGLLYQSFDYPNSIILNSEGTQYENLFVHENEKYSAIWLSISANEKNRIFADHYGRYRLVSQGNYYYSSVSTINPTVSPEVDKSYLYLRHYNIDRGKFVVYMREMKSYLYYDLFADNSYLYYKNLVYSNGGSKIYFNIEFS